MTPSKPWRAFAEATATAPPAVRARVRARLEGAGDGNRRPRAWPRLAAVAATFAVLLVVGLWRPWGASPEQAELTLRTDTRSQTVELPHDGRLAVAAHTRVQVAASEDDGALVVLDEGEVELSVHRSPGARWRVKTGAYEVEAVGTRFRVRRRGPAPEVEVLEGVVRVTGPGLSAEGLRVRAGEDVALEAPAAKPEPERTPEPAPEPEPPPPAVETAPAPRPAATPAWVAEFRRARRRGDRSAALSALPADFPRGGARLRARDYVDAADLLAADGQAERAERAYARACKLAPRSSACGISLFRRSLSRARAGDLDGAIELADRYLSRRPRGTFARDVLGRRMQWLATRGRGAAARADAERYLERWPDGPHADRARALLGRAKP